MRRGGAGTHLRQAGRGDRGELEFYDSTLGNCVKQDRIDRGEGDGLTSDQRARLRELEAENARLGMERDLLR